MKYGELWLHWGVSIVKSPLVTAQQAQRQVWQPSTSLFYNNINMKGQTCWKQERKLSSLFVC